MPLALAAVCYFATLQGWAKEWALGCVNSPPAAGGSDEAGFTQPRAHFFAQPCIYFRVTNFTPVFSASGGFTNGNG